MYERLGRSVVFEFNYDGRGRGWSEDKGGEEGELVDCLCFFARTAQLPGFCPYFLRILIPEDLRKYKIICGLLIHRWAMKKKGSKMIQAKRLKRVTYWLAWAILLPPDFLFERSTSFRSSVYRDHAFRNIYFWSFFESLFVFLATFGRRLRSSFDLCSVSAHPCFYSCLLNP